MIRLSPECYPCFFRQADLAAQACGAPEEARVALAGRIAAFLAAAPAGEIPARVATGLQALVREVLGPDPYAAVKERELARFDETSRRAAAQAAGEGDPIGAAFRAAAFGNIMDAGLVDGAAMDAARHGGPGGNGGPEVPPRLRERLAAAGTVGVLLDNAGEAAYDVPLLSLLARDGKRVWIGVKGGAVIDDLTEAEARRIGLAAYGEIVSNGNQAVGTDLDLCAPGFRERLAGSDLVIVKGQANFETLAGRLPRAFFVLRCKCPVVARALGHPVGAMLVLDGEALP